MAHTPDPAEPLAALREISGREGSHWSGYEPRTVAYELAVIARAAIPKAEAAEETSRAMLDVLKLVAENEECACDDFEDRCRRCGWARDKEIHSEHPYVSPKPCLGCQVDAAIALAEKGE